MDEAGILLVTERAIFMPRFHRALTEHYAAMFAVPTLAAPKILKNTVKAADAAEV